MRHGFIVELFVIERRKGRDDGDAERFLARNSYSAQDAPGSLCVADAGLLGKPVNRNGEFGSAAKYFIGEYLRELDRAGAAKVSAPPVAHVCPAFEKYPLMIVLFH